MATETYTRLRRRLLVKNKGIDCYTETVTRSMDHLRSQLITKQRAESHQYWHRLRENRQNKDQRFTNQQIEETVTMELETMMEFDRKVDFDHIKQLADSGHCLPTQRAFRRWFKRYDPAAYKQDYIDPYLNGKKDRYHHARKQASNSITRSAPDQVTKPNLTNQTLPKEDVIAKAKRVMGDRYQAPAFLEFSD